MNTLTIKDIMTRDIMMAHAHWTLDRLAEFFTDNYISGAPVVADDGELVGVVSLTDMVRHNSLHDSFEGNDVHEYYHQFLGEQYAREEIAALRIRTEALVTVRDIMTPIIFEVHENATPQEVADAMIRGRIHRVFVTRDKRVVGIVSALDMLRIIRDM